jgi:hypothetical protein
MTTQVVILRAAGSFASRFARLKNARKAFFNGLVSSNCPSAAPTMRPTLQLQPELSFARPLG